MVFQSCSERTAQGRGFHGWGIAFFADLIVVGMVSLPIVRGSAGRFEGKSKWTMALTKSWHLTVGLVVGQLEI
jgi:hypothetical protein